MKQEMNDNPISASSDTEPETIVLLFNINSIFYSSKFETP